MKRSREDCAICLTDLGSEVTVTLECGHCYHSTCLCFWFRRNPACPLCRALPESESGESGDDLSAMTMQHLTSHVSGALRAARGKGADPALRRAATTFRRARDAAVAARINELAYANSEPFHTQMGEMHRLSILEIERRRDAAARATTLLGIWERTPEAPRTTTPSRGSGSQRRVTPQPRRADQGPGGAEPSGETT